MSNIEQLLELLNKIDITPRAAEKAQLLLILRAIVSACRERNSEELDRQAKAFLSLAYDPGSIFLGFTPEPTSISVELFNEIENKTLTVLERIAASEPNEKD